MATSIQLPNKWEARHYQRELFRYLLDGGLESKRAVMVWHRRAGKDSTSINFAAVASQMRVGTIWHMLPTARQGRKVIWDAIDRDGRKVIDQAFPPEMVVNKNNTEMKLECENGSIYQVVGSDNFDSLVGSNPVGVIFSEYSIANPEAWNFVRPILAENGGWAIFIYTPRGKNHGFTLFEMARENPRWFCSLKTAEDTYRANELPESPDEFARLAHVIGPEVIDEERRSGMGEEKIAQEYYCSFETGLEGAFYTAELKSAYEEGRIGNYPWDPHKICQTFWDIGRDTTAIGITQVGPDGHPVIIDYISDRNIGLPEWIKKISVLPYQFEEDSHFGPHDLNHTDWATNRTRLETAAGLGLHFNLVAKLSLADGVDAARQMLRVCKINQPNCQDLLDGLASYHREYDDKRGVFRDIPVHDWASHPADMFRYLSVAWEEYRLNMQNLSSQFKVIRSVGG